MNINKLAGGNRQSNIELLRNVSMFMILMLHANFVAMGKPTTVDLSVSPVSTAFRWFIEAISISSVNAFVLISGWFGIKASLKGTLKLIYQILFFLGISYIIAICLGVLESPLNSLLDVLQLTRYDWFIKSYFVLIILSPLLNQFNNLEVAKQRVFLLLFFGFEAVYGWAAGGNRFFVGGYGPLHLMGIYLLGQYMHFSLPQEENTNGLGKMISGILNLKSGLNLVLFLLCSIMIAAMGITDLMFTGGNWSNTILAYSSPLVVAASVFLFLAFKRMEIKTSKLINWLGASSFAVYLLHGDPIVRHMFFIPLFKEIDVRTSGIYEVLIAGGSLVLIFLLSCLIDQIRIASWNILCKRLPNCIK